MPNWSISKYEILINSVEEATQFYNKLNEWTSNIVMENYWNDNWLGNLIVNSGLDNLNFENYPGRGSVYDIVKVGNTVRLTMETAWGPYHNIIYDLCEKKLESDYEIFYTNYIEGVREYYTNNLYYEDLYIIDDYNGNIEYNDKVTKKGIIKILKEELRTNEVDFDKLVNLAEERDIIIRKWEVEW